MLESQRVNIFSFTGHREYLKELHSHLKRVRPGFGLRAFARAVGFRSPGTLSMIMNGKRRLTLNAADKLASAITLTGRRRNYFMMMARYDGAGSEMERANAYGMMMKLRTATNRTELELRQYRFLAIWYYPVIYALVGTKNFRWNAEWIAARIGQGITCRQVKTAIGDLLALKLLREENGKLARSTPPVTTADDVKDLGAHRYHRQMISLALASMELPLEQRELNGLTVAVPKDQLPTVKEKIRELRRELNELLSSHQGDAEDVYQLNIQFFPVTRSGVETEEMGCTG